MGTERTFPEELDDYFLRRLKALIGNKLKKLQEEDGVTVGELAKGCGQRSWCEAAAGEPGKKNMSVTLMSEFVHWMWRRGLVFLEPPIEPKKKVRIWDVESARARWPHLLPGARPPEKVAEKATPPDAADGAARLKKAYEKFLPEHTTGYVPIYKIRREFGGSRAEFDDLLRDLNERPVPEIQLIGGDPQRFTEEQKEDSFKRKGTLYLRLRWR